MRRIIALTWLLALGIAIALLSRKRSRDWANAVGLGSQTYGPISRWMYRQDSWHSTAYPMALESLALSPMDAYLDVACGAGGLVARALETVEQAAGIDHSSAAIEVATEVNAEAIAAGRADIRLGDAADLPWEDGSFDAVSNLNTIHVIEDPRPLLREMHRVLRPGGRLVLITQSLEPLQGPLWAPIRGWMTLHTDAELERLLADAGFGAIEISCPDGERQLAVGVKEAPKAAVA